jgi:hypothetical protein
MKIFILILIICFQYSKGQPNRDITVEPFLSQNYFLSHYSSEFEKAPTFEKELYLTGPDRLPMLGGKPGLGIWINLLQNKTTVSTGTMLGVHGISFKIYGPNALERGYEIYRGTLIRDYTIKFPITLTHNLIHKDHYRLAIRIGSSLDKVLTKDVITFNLDFINQYDTLITKEISLSETKNSTFAILTGLKFCVKTGNNEISFEGIYNKGLRPISAYDINYEINSIDYWTRLFSNGSYFGLNASYSFSLNKHIQKLKKHKHEKNHPGILNYPYIFYNRNLSKQY